MQDAKAVRSAQDTKTAERGMQDEEVRACRIQRPSETYMMQRPSETYMIRVRSDGHRIQRQTDRNI